MLPFAAYRIGNGIIHFAAYTAASRDFQCFPMGWTTVKIASSSEGSRFPSNNDSLGPPEPALQSAFRSV